MIVGAVAGLAIWSTAMIVIMWLVYHSTGRMSPVDGFDVLLGIAFASGGALLGHVL